jgi:hypothetical protein
MSMMRRWFRVVGYSFVAGGGVVTLVYPPVTAFREISPTTGPFIYLWAALLTVGGITSAVGSASDIWLGEYAGLWPIIITFTIYGATSLFTGNHMQLGFSAILIGWACLLSARWHEVALIRIEAIRFSKYRRYRPRV